MSLEPVGPPAGAVDVPVVVTELAAREPVWPVWSNVLGGLPFARRRSSVRAFTPCMTAFWSGPVRSTGRWADERATGSASSDRSQRSTASSCATGTPAHSYTLIGPDVNWSGHVDFGALGVVDCWADLAVATASTVWNFGPGFEDAVLHVNGIERDGERRS